MTVLWCALSAFIAGLAVSWVYDYRQYKLQRRIAGLIRDNADLLRRAESREQFEKECG